MNKVKVFMIVLTLIILALVITLVVFGLPMFVSNVKEIEGVKCAVNQRLTIYYPFCSDLQSCMNDCKLVNGNFIQLRYQSKGIGQLHLCYCKVKEDITNIW